jgi:hypothetical protein
LEALVDKEMLTLSHQRISEIGGVSAVVLTLAVTAAGLNHMESPRSSLAGEYSAQIAIIFNTPSVALHTSSTTVKIAPGKTLLDKVTIKGGKQVSNYLTTLQTLV